MFRNWFTLPELIALNIALLPAIFFVGLEIFKAFATLRYKWIYICTIILPLFLMNQTLPPTHLDTSFIKKFNIYHTTGGGFEAGKFTDERYTYTGSGCSVVSEYQYFSQKYSAGGIGYCTTKGTPDRREVIRYGINAFIGEYSQIRLTTQNPKINPFCLSIYVKCYQTCRMWSKFLVFVLSTFTNPLFKYQEP